MLGEFIRWILGEHSAKLQNDQCLRGECKAKSEQLLSPSANNRRTVQNGDIFFCHFPNRGLLIAPTFFFVISRTGVFSLLRQSLFRQALLRRSLLRQSLLRRSLLRHSLLRQSLLRQLLFRRSLPRRRK